MNELDFVGYVVEIASDGAEDWRECCATDSYRSCVAMLADISFDDSTWGFFGVYAVADRAGNTLYRYDTSSMQAAYDARSAMLARHDERAYEDYLDSL